MVQCGPQGDHVPRRLGAHATPAQSAINRRRFAKRSRRRHAASIYPQPHGASAFSTMNSGVAGLVCGQSRNVPWKATKRSDRNAQRPADFEMALPPLMWNTFLVPVPFENRTGTCSCQDHCRPAHTVANLIQRRPMPSPVRVAVRSQISDNAHLRTPACCKGHSGQLVGMGPHEAHQTSIQSAHRALAFASTLLLDRFDLRTRAHLTVKA